MPSLTRYGLVATRRALLVLALTPLVHWSGSPQAQGDRARRGGAAKGAAGKASAPEIIIGQGRHKLPPAVADMRSAILSAVESGDISELRLPIDLNELKPELGQPAGGDPIAHLRSISGDGQGREILAILARVLEAPWAAIPGGKDVENNRMYVWPAFAEIPLDGLKPADEVELYKLVTPAEAKAMREAKRWMWWRLSIGADGVWHTFTRLGPAVK